MSETEKPSGSSPEYAALFLEGESENAPSGAEGGSAHTKREEDHSAGLEIPDESYYDEPVYASKEEEDAANKKAYTDMTKILLSASQAADEYRKDFDPVYDELVGGLMNAFIAGREQIFYEDIADYCFGRYNTSHHVGMVRFDALIENTDEKETVILEFFTDEAMQNELLVPDLAYCSYNKKTEAFVFFTGGR